MSKDIEEQLEPITNWLIETVEKSEGFLVEQAPLVAQEIILYARLESAGGVVAFIAAASLTVFVGFRMRAAASNPEIKMARDSRDMLHGFCVASWAMAAIILFGSVPSWAYLIKCFVAPRLVILEYLRAL